MSRPKQKKALVAREPVHPFPARMAAGIALDAISRTRRHLRILDPMTGSGTVLAVARLKGHKAFGVDIDPLAVLIASAWTTAVDKQFIKLKAARTLQRAKKRFKILRLHEAYPPNADAETKSFIRYWFDPYVRRQLTCLAAAINGCRENNVRNVLWCAFSRLIIAKQAGASLALDLSHSRPHRRFEKAPAKPFRGFLKAVDRVLENCLSVSDKGRGPHPTIRIGDARKLDLTDESIDLVLTSPPYLNAIDYMRCSKFSLVWMGHTTTKTRILRSRSIGTEVGRYGNNEDDLATKIIGRLQLNRRLSARHKAVLSQFIHDMNLAINETARVLVPRGKAIYVVGENTIKGTYIQNAKIITAIAHQAGLILKKRRSRTLPPNRRYLPPPSSRKRRGALNARMRREVVLTFVKRRARQTS